jgi:hypothetical protein
MFFQDSVADTSSFKLQVRYLHLVDTAFESKLADQTTDYPSDATFSQRHLYTS